MKHEQWLTWLEEQLAVNNDQLDMDWTPGEMIANVFHITTYDSAADRLFAEQITEVLEVIANRTTFDYQAKSTEQYFRFLMVVNFRAIYPLLEWGTSIRGCWFNLGFGRVFDPADGLTKFDGKRYPTVISQEEMGEFVKAVRMFLDKHPEPEDEEKPV